MGNNEKHSPSYPPSRSRNRKQTDSDTEPRTADINESSASQIRSPGPNPNFVPLTPFSHFDLPQSSHFPPLRDSPHVTTNPAHSMAVNSHSTFLNVQHISPQTQQQHPMWLYTPPLAAQPPANNPAFSGVGQMSPNINPHLQGQYSFPAYFAPGPSRLPPIQSSSELSPQSPSTGASPPAQSPLDTEDPSVVEDKRRRNTAASARFRIKKKQKSFNLERTVADLTIRADELEKEASDLRKENAWLKDIVIMKGKKNMIDSQGPKAPNRPEKHHDETTRMAESSADSADDSDVNDHKSREKGKGREKSGRGRGKEKDAKAGLGKKERKS